MHLTVALACVGLSNWKLLRIFFFQFQLLLVRSHMCPIQSCIEMKAGSSYRPVNLNKLLKIGEH